MQNKAPFKIPWRSLSLQMLVVLILPAALILIAVTVSSYTVHQQAMRSLVGERDQRAVQTAARALQSEIEHRTAGILSVSLRATSDQPALPKQILNSSTFLLNDFDSGIAFYSRSGELLAVIGDETFWKSIPRDQPELRAALAQNSGQPFVSRSFRSTESSPPMVLISSATPTGNWVVVGAFSPQKLAQNTLAGAFPIGPEFSIYLLDGSSQVLYEGGSLNPGGNPCIHPNIVKVCAQSSAMTYIWVGSSEHVVAYSPVQPVGWGLVTEESWQAVENPTLENTQLAPFVLIPVLLISLAALWFGARQIVQPLQKLEGQASLLGRGNFQEIENPVGGIAEIRHLQNELVNMARKLQAAQRSLHGYIGAITGGLEEERRRLARDLHDDTIQSLIALKQRVQLAHIDSPDGRAGKTLEETEKLAEETIDDLRRVIRDLRPIYLEDLGLAPALEMLANETQKGSSVPVEFKSQGEERRLPPEAELALFRMAQESLSNVVRHSRASQAGVKLAFGEKSVTLLIWDNGQGFIAPTSRAEFAPKGHYGLLGLYERAELIDASLEIDTAPGKGTRIKVCYPFPPAKV